MSAAGAAAHPWCRALSVEGSRWLCKAFLQELLWPHSGLDHLAAGKNTAGPPLLAWDRKREGARAWVGAELNAKWEEQELHSFLVGSPTTRDTGMCDVLMQHTPHRMKKDLGLGPLEIMQSKPLPRQGHLEQVT